MPVSSTTDLFADIETQLAGLLDGERDLIANAANCAALLYERLPDINWAGFYFLRDGELVVGPFQGRPACVRIPLGRGVCGIAARDRASLRVDDVNEFADHIACDINSRSEIVVPLVKDGRLLGVLDIDSPSRARFDADDQAGLERIAARFVDAVDASINP
ncbi:MAG: GAF domain-containing protein [Gammaproteobacteria bacterium]